MRAAKHVGKHSSRPVSQPAGGTAARGTHGWDGRNPDRKHVGALVAQCHVTRTGAFTDATDRLVYSR